MPDVADGGDFVVTAGEKIEGVDVFDEGLSDRQGAHKPAHV